MRKKTKIRLLDKKGFTKIIEVPGFPLKVTYLFVGGKAQFGIFDFPRRGLPIFKEV